MNLVDSERMLGKLAQDGYALVPDADGADVVVVNTCGFIEPARQESLAVIREMLELKEQGRAILFSTHRMDQVEKLCDSICLINNGQAVLAGTVREIKSRYERNRVIVEFEGSAEFLKSTEIAEAKNFSGHAEIKLRPHGDAQKLLREATEVATIYRFELVEPSLEEIFIQTVGGDSGA